MPKSEEEGDSYDILEGFDHKIQELFDVRELQSRMLAWIKRKVMQTKEDSDLEEKPVGAQEAPEIVVE